MFRGWSLDSLTVTQFLIFLPVFVSNPKSRSPYGVEVASLSNGFLLALICTYLLIPRSWLIGWTPVDLCSSNPKPTVLEHPPCLEPLSVVRKLRSFGYECAAVPICFPISGSLEPGSCATVLVIGSPSHFLFLWGLIIRVDFPWFPASAWLYPHWWPASILRIILISNRLDSLSRYSVL